MRLAIVIIMSLLWAGELQGYRRHEISINRLPDFKYGHYKVDPYIQIASDLQSLGKEAAIKKLMAFAKDRKQDNKAIMLCRMLFSPKANSEFRRPRIGGAAFLGKTDYADWPLEPIEIVDGVPFIIVIGYQIQGQPEPAELYLRYCLQNFEWNEFRYKIKSAQEKQTALRKLLASPKWKDAPPETFLSEQIQ